MAKQKKTIALVCNGVERTFEFQHALRILTLEAKKSKKNWQIAEKGYEFKNNEIISTRDSGDSKES